METENGKRKVWVGIDPGRHGCLCAFVGDDVEFMPFEDCGYHDVSVYLDGLRDKYRVIVAIEDVHSMPRQGVASSFKFGFETGILHGMMIAKNIPFVTVRPQDWQKSVWIRSDKVTVGNKTETKKTSMNAARRLFPETDLRRNSRCKAIHDGMCDALLITEYARRNNL